MMEIYIAIFFFFILTISGAYAVILFTEKLRRKESWPYETRRQKDLRQKESPWAVEPRRRDDAKHWPW